jgi:hypothetical protein
VGFEKYSSGSSETPSYRDLLGDAIRVGQREGKVLTMLN